MLKELQTQSIDDTISPMDYLILLLKEKKLILIITFAFAVITAAISLSMPEIYRAETKLLRPQNKSPSMTSIFMSQFSNDGMVNSPNALYVSLLYSRSVLEGVVEQFNLIEIYGAGTVEDARNRLKTNIYAKYNRNSGIITLAVEDRDPQMAADLANAFVGELKKLTKRLATTEAAQRRVFFGEQLEDAKESLINAEEDMASFQARTGILKMDEQAKAVIEAISRIKAKVSEKEVRLKVMRTYSTPNNPDLQKVEEALKGLKVELRKLSKGQGKNYYQPMSTEKMPKLGTEYIRKLREFKYSESLYNIFLKQYEAAKLDEAREVLLVQALDEAVPPEKRVSPKRTRMVIIGTFSGFIFSIFVVFILEYSATISDDPKHRERLKMLKKYASIRPKS